MILQQTQLKKDLKKLSAKKRALSSMRFFKTGPGEYGEGDQFIGVKVPDQRKIAKKYKDLPLSDIQKLLSSKIHEHRLTGLLILVRQYQDSEKLREKSENFRKKIFNFYLNNTRQVNNWDLVDLSAPNIVGEYLLDKDRKVLYKLAKSKNIWERRIAILATFAFIKKDDFTDTIKIAGQLLQDDHDLIHKAVGWMLREVGKRNMEVEEKFLKKYKNIMPRTTLRYAIERFPEKKRKSYM